jgi:hypothetical protein
MKKKSQLELNIPLHESEHGVNVNGRYTVEGKVEWLGKMYPEHNWNKRKFLISYQVARRNKSGTEIEYLLFETVDKQFHWMNKLDNFNVGDIVLVDFRIDCRRWIKDGEQQYDKSNNTPMVFMSLVPTEIALVERGVIEQEDVKTEEDDSLPF